jgi:hypothetical protein
MPMVGQLLHELPEPQKMDHRLLAFLEKYKMTSVGSLRNETIDIPQASQRDMPRDFAQYATVG